ncbi:hypothetical protein [Calycomorphotria hydatis]|uniref:Uncharacterized protein n=1 Tax=Calycomorphotria hydatis TaxID=2528027 RepID=A0A517T398_9PLAN|nr:hypothetical protein [Calycomorphotria hydatis]QDT62857.1 hypothetical protein V22_00550 [Calycomorphotria hydatis]
MTRISLDPKQLEQLSPDGQMAELVGPEGEVIGFFVPNICKKSLEPQIDSEEINQRIANGGGRPLRQIVDEYEEKLR